MNPIHLSMPSMAALKPGKVKQTQPAQFAGKHDKKPTSFLVGTGTVKERPDTMSMTITLEGSAKNTRELAINDLDQKGTELVQALEALKKNHKLQSLKIIPSKINTRLHKPYDQKQQKHVFDGYIGVLHINLSEKSAKSQQLAEHAARIAETATNHEADFSSPKYGLSEKRLEAAREKATKLAYQDAKKRASWLADEAEYKLSAIPSTEILDQDQYSYNAASGEAFGARALSGGGARISNELVQAPDITVSEKVKVIFKITAKAPKSKLDQQA